ncbi:hypothetical protein BDW74DRAFT_180798 [Aspergillus multicolor]|uniref:uncharacterized protein n=1 Tax=Aspergillus multicolor TaxID=41759 RepID=UPI003CCD56EA
MSTSISTSPTPPRPSSPRLRRAHLKIPSNPKTQGLMTVETYLHKTDGYRSTTMPNPWPYHLTTTPANPALAAKVNECTSAIKDILSAHGLPIEDDVLSIDLVLVTKTGYPGGHTPRLTLQLLWTDVAYAPSRNELDNARDAIAALLVEKRISCTSINTDTSSQSAREGQTDIDVNLAFLDLCFRPSTFSIPSTHPAAAAFETARKEILKLINKRLGDSWCNISLFLLGLIKEKSDPTVVVHVLPHTVADWSALGAEIKEQLPPKERERINAEFLPESFAMSLDGR